MPCSTDCIRWESIAGCKNAAKVGKTSIIEVLITASFEEEVQPVLPVLVVPREVTPEHVHVSIVDTPGDPQLVSKVDEELKQADVVVLVYSVNDERTQERVSTFWLQKFRNDGVEVPIILVGNKIDTRGGITDPAAAAKMEAFIKPIMDKYKEVDVCIECSAKTVSNISEVFYFAQKAVLHPTRPLYDVENHSLKPSAEAALRRIFKICDKDRDGGLSDKELNDFQFTCFNVLLQPDELAGVKKVVQENKPRDGIRPDGSISVEGFIYLHTLFVQKGRLETTWIVLRKFGYGDDMRLPLDDKTRIRRSDDQSVELSAKGKQFLSELFATADKDADGMLSPAELKEAFSDYPDPPFTISHSENLTWKGERFTCRGKSGNPNYMTLDSFLSRWTLYTLESPNDAMLAMMYLGYLEAPLSAFKITKSRKRDRYNRAVSREVFNIMVIGDDGRAKTDIIRGLVGEPATGQDNPECAAVASLDASELSPGAGTRTIVMRDVPLVSTDSLFGSRPAIDAADVLCIVFDASSEKSFETARSLWKRVQSLRPSIVLPVVFVASTENLEKHSVILSEADELCLTASLSSPVRVSMKDGDNGSLYKNLLGVALYPQVACPDYYDIASSGTSAAKTALKVLAGGFIVGGLLYGAKRIYDYCTTKPTTTS